MNLRRNLLARSRRGFTMIELIVVILIIIVLAALLLPAVMGALRSKELVQQTDDMGKLTAALEAFKSRYGMYPPSRIRLREGTPYNLNEGFDAHSVKMLKLIWPSINPVTVNGAAGDPNTTELVAAQNGRRFLWCVDFPGKETGSPQNWDGIYELEGDECLVFFLGGIAQFDRATPNSEIILHGFTHSPNNPSGIPNVAVPATLNRDAPLMTFDPTRLYVRVGDTQIEPPPAAAINNTSATSPTVGHAFPNAQQTRYLNTNAATIQKLPSYLALGPSNKTDRRPWVYFSAYGGTGYRPDDVNFPTTSGYDWFESVDPTTNPSTVAQQRFQLSYLGPRVSGPNSNYVNTVSAFPNPYTMSFPYGQPDAGTTLAQGATSRWHNANTYQLISPGTDGRYGPGGQIPRSNVGADSPPDLTSVDLASNGSSFDNVTNISGSARLGEFNIQQNKSP